MCGSATTTNIMRDSRSQFPEAEVEEETFREYALRLMKTKFVETIPSSSIKELQPKYLYSFGAIAHLFSLACFVYFIWTGFKNAMSVQFISLNKEDGRCQAVLKPVTGTFLGDIQGQWFGNPGFDISLSKYSLELQNFEQTVHEYRDMMDQVNVELTLLGKKALRRDLADNILLWITWQTVLTNSKTVNTFSMKGNPLVVFNRDLNLGLFASIAGECLVPATASFVESTGKFHLATNATQFRNDPVCTRAAVPENLGYNAYYDYENFDLAMDTRTAAIAAAVNTKIIEASSLNKITVTERRFEFNGTNVTMNQRFSDRYPGMVPTRCFLLDSKEFCLMRIGTTYGYPILLHFGTDQDRPDPCDCDQGDAMKYPYCHTFDFMIGFLFYNLPSVNDDDSNQLSLSTVALLTLMQKSNILDLNRQAYNISYAAAMYDTDLYEEFQTPQWRSKAYDFCTLRDFGSCSLILFNAFDSNSHSVSDYNFQLLLGACRDSFTTSNWYLLAETPPTQLTQTYYECTKEPQYAILDSIGIASGNTATFVPLFLIFSVPLLFAYLQLSGDLPPKKEYTQEDTSAAMETLALLMLRIRDGKVRGIVRNGILQKLTDELIKSAKNEGGFPDSDDEDDEDEDLEKQSPAKNNNHHPKRGSAKAVSSIFASHAASSPTSPSSKSEPLSSSSTSWFSSFFSSAPPAAESVPSESPLHGGVEMASIPKDLKVLNDHTLSVDTGAGPLVGREIQECVTHLRTVMEKALKAKGVDGASTVFRSIENKTVDLKRVDLLSLPPDQISFIFGELHDTLLNHARVHYGAVTQEDESQMAYNVGGRIYTGTQMQRLHQSGNVSPHMLINTGWHENSNELFHL